MPYKFEKAVVFGLGERGSGFKARSVGGHQHFKKIKARCLADAIKFEDDEFPATNSSIGDVEGGPFIWKRPHEIIKEKKPQFIIDGAERFDVIQGNLGNCWLLAAIADLTLQKEMFHMVVPDDNTFHKEYTGAFHFRFWQFGKWIDVVIDDRLPCTHEDGKLELAFMNSGSKNEFWSALLEKAYAKLSGSYEVLDGGLTFEALEDFTGGFTEVFLLERLKTMNLVKGPEEFFNLLEKSFEKSPFMGSSVKEQPGTSEAKLENGLICGHSYSITDLRRITATIDGVPKQIELTRLRNPWGSDDEWNGDWCDSSPLWDNVSQEERANIQLTFAADGEFWMSYADFLTNFERVEVCHTNPSSEDKDGKIRPKSYVSHSIGGTWTLGVTAGGSRKHRETFANNPQYVLTVGNPGDKEEYTIIICLLKKERKAEPETSGVKNLSFNIFPLKKEAPIPLSTEYLFDNENEPLAQLKPLNGLREITVRFVVPAGTYCIIPSSIKPNQEGEFLLRVFSEGDSTLKLYDLALKIREEEIEVKDENPEEKARLGKARDFFKMVAGDDDEVNWWELKLILDKSFRDEFEFEGFGWSEDVCRSIVALMDEDRSGKLSFFEFTNLWAKVSTWKKIFSEHDKDRSHLLGSLKTNELRTALLAGGYEVNKDILEAIVLRYGDKNGEISLDKFIVAVLKLKTMITLYKHHEIEGEDVATVNLNDWLSGTIYS